MQCEKQKATFNSIFIAVYVSNMSHEIDTEETKNEVSQEFKVF